MKIRVQLTGGEGTAPGITYPGELTAEEEENFSLFWHQPPENSRDPQITFRLVYSGTGRPMTLKRTGDTGMHLAFLEGRRTKGILSTGHGDMYLETDTKLMRIIRGGQGTGEGPVSGILLHYNLYFEGQPPVRNELKIEIRLENQQRSE